MASLRAVLVASHVAATLLGAVAVGWGEPGSAAPESIPLDTAVPELYPPRARLDRTAALRLNGTVGDCVRSLAEMAGRDWIVGVPGPQFAVVADYAVDSEPMWRALDRLLDLYGYDWGVHAGTIVAWPARRPARHRQVPPPDEEQDRADEPKRTPLVLGALTPVRDVLGGLSAAFDGIVRSRYVDPELSEWSVVGRITNPDYMNTQCILSAIGAVPEVGGGLAALKVSALHRLGLALALRSDARGSVGDATGGRDARTQLDNAVLGLLTAQQWVYLRHGGEALLAFREFPTEVAALFLDVSERVDALKTAGAAIDWSQPHRMYVSAVAGHAAVQQLDGTTVTAPILTVSCNAPLANGKMIRF